MSSEQVNRLDDLATEAIAAINGEIDSSGMSMESMVLLINAERLRFLENKITKEFKELKERQDKVAFLNSLNKKINSATVKDELDITSEEELKTMLEKAKEYGVDVKDGKLKFNKEERDRLIENIRLTVDDLNVLNDMQLQTVTRLTTERYESYQLARSIMKPLHEDKVSKARAMGGR